jgi:drug/metabolite transporter (DMT)-like permease
MTTKRGRADRITFIAFVAMVVGIGGNVVAVRYIARGADLDPMWAAASRFFLATLIFVVIARAQRASFPRGRALAGAMLYGALSIGAFFALAYWGLQEAPAGIAGVLLATNPLVTYLFALGHRVERFRWDSMTGAVVVVAGTAVVLGAGIGEDIPALSMLAILGASVCAAEGAIIVKTFPPVKPSMRNAIGMGTGTVMLSALMPLFGESASVPQSASTWIAQAYLVTLGSVGVFGLYLFILSRWTASAVSYEFVAAPIVAIAASAVIFDEKVTILFGLGSVLVLAGVYLGAIKPAHADARTSTT